MHEYSFSTACFIVCSWSVTPGCDNRKNVLNALQGPRPPLSVHGHKKLKIFSKHMFTSTKCMHSTFSKPKLCWREAKTSASVIILYPHWARVYSFWSVLPAGLAASVLSGYKVPDVWRPNSFYPSPSSCCCCQGSFQACVQYQEGWNQVPCWPSAHNAKEGQVCH